MKLSRKHLALLMAAGTLLATGTSWATTTGIIQPPISLGSTLEGGGVATVTARSGSFTVEQGKAQQIAGVELFQIDLGAARFSDLITVEVLLLNPGDLSRVLNNPNAYMDVALWFESASGTYTLSDGVTKVAKDLAAEGRINRASGAVVLQPRTPAVTRYYVLATITTPGGGVPSNEQQGQLTRLDFHSEVRM